MELSSIKRVYFIGAGGIGMSAIARYFLHKKVVVNGYDKTPTPLTQKLIEEGAAIHFEDSVALLDTKADMVIYTPAIPKDHLEMNWYKHNGFTLFKRSDVLQIITRDMFSICIGGTHGKTTISSMTAHLLHHSGFGCTAFLGGISSNYNTNFLHDRNDVCVVEADEYDRSFHKLSPSIAVVSAMDPDHLDIYGTPEAMQDAFVEFAEMTKTGGLLIYKEQLSRLEKSNVEEKFSYSLYDEKSYSYVDNLKAYNGGYFFYAHIGNEVIKNLYLSIGGLHNIENALVAITIAKRLGIDDEKIVNALAEFKGVKRRFEYVLRNEEYVVIDDYAHHPEELNALISGARSVFPDRRMTIVFQPHLFSRTRDLADGFAEALDKADDILLLPIYPARELLIDGVSSTLILNKMKNERKTLIEKRDLKQWVDINKPTLLLLAGAGDIDAEVSGIVEVLKNK